MLKILSRTSWDLKPLQHRCSSVNQVSVVMKGEPSILFKSYSSFSLPSILAMFLLPAAQKMNKFQFLSQDWLLSRPSPKTWLLNFWGGRFSHLSEALFEFLVTPLTEALGIWALSLSGWSFGKVLLTPIIILEPSVLMGTFKDLEMVLFYCFFYPCPDLCLNSLIMED